MTTVSLSDLLIQISDGLDAVEAGLLGATPYHSKRVAVFCLGIGRQLGYSDERLFTLAGCALLHDNALTEYILSEKPGKSKAINLKSHCIIGEENGQYMPFPYSSEGFIKYHHEQADGSGVFRLKEGQYPEEAGIIALADQVDVRFRLQTLDAGRLDNVRKYISESVGRRYSRETALAALQILDSKLLEDMKDDRIGCAIRERLPEIGHIMTDAELLGLSGITAKIIDYKSEFTREHTSQIANKSWYMSGIYGYDQKQRAMLYLAAAMHDVGKLFIPTSILEKPGRLTDEEFKTIQSHVLHTWDLIHPIKGYEEIALWASNHHEKLDGSGYPFGKTAGQLDFNSRLMTCLDIYQAVRETRPYHPSRSHKDTMAILYEMARAGQIDPDICRDLDVHLKELEGGFAPFPDLGTLSSPAGPCLAQS